MNQLPPPAVLAEDLRALADVVPFDEHTRAMLEHAAHHLDDLDRQAARVGRCGCTPPLTGIGNRLADMTSCTLPGGHAGWHRDDEMRSEWGRLWREDQP